MSVTRKAFHLPPYISTSWAHVVSLHMEHEDHEQLLVVTLSNGAQICIPNLDERLLQHIFMVHAEVLEGTTAAIPPTRSVQFERDESKMRAASYRTLPEAAETGALLDEAGTSTRAGILDDLSLDPDRLAELEEQLLEHRPELGQSPELPTALLQRMSLMGRFLHPSLLAQLPRAVDGCCCPFCQIHRVLHGEPPDTALPPGEEIAEDDLSFRSWTVRPTGDQLFEVSNQANPEETYRVFLGEPLGCTCGEPKCEHMRAALQAD